MFFSGNAYGNGRGGRSQNPNYNWPNSSSGSGASNGFGYKGGFSSGSNGNHGGRANASKTGGFSSWNPSNEINEAKKSDSSSLVPISKDNYTPVASVQDRDQADVDRWMAENNVSLNGEDVPCPVFEFEESTFPGMIVNLLLTHFQKPTPIQSISWPVALSGHDLISIAKTGSGKTIGFILPSIVHVQSQPARNLQDGPAVIILLPTRELAQQVEQVAQEYCKVMRISLACCYGGSPKGPQMSAMKRGVDICVATPGRLTDFIDTNVVKLKRCSLLIMDEADRMLDMGFEPQIRKIAQQIRNDRQTLMFSATWPQDVRKLAADFQKNPIHLTVGSLELSANHNIEQNVEVIDEYNKTKRLEEILEDISKQVQSKTIIFVKTKRKADELSRLVRQSGYPALCIHGDKDQSERNWVLEQFKQGKASILLATDVAARGIDVHDIKFVINYDYPNSSEDYIHRIGRTGRRDQKGTAYSFFTSGDNAKAADLVKVLQEANQNIPEELEIIAFMRDGRGRGNGRKRDWNSGNENSYGGRGRGGAGAEVIASVGNLMDLEEESQSVFDMMMKVKQVLTNQTIQEDLATFEADEVVDTQAIRGGLIRAGRGIFTFNEERFLVTVHHCYEMNFEIY
uniref:RNA helicase n=1 Tax=Meloidogyne floridensis TaxID=298350 RepID=A0A915P7W1_9BILA